MLITTLILVVVRDYQKKSRSLNHLELDPSNSQADLSSRDTGGPMIGGRISKILKAKLTLVCFRTRSQCTWKLSTTSTSRKKEKARCNHGFW